MLIRLLSRRPKQASFIVKGQSGFTLVELVIVSALLGVLFLVLYGALNGIIRSKRSIEGARSGDRVAQFVFSRMAVELRNYVEEPLTSLALAGRSGPGRSTNQAFMLGVNSELGDFDADSIRFVSSNVGQMVFGGFPNRGLVEIEYKLEEDNDSLAEEAVSTLIREEIPSGIADIDLVKSRKIRFPISERVKGLNFRYLSAEQWYDNWPQRGEKVPDAVEISLVVARDDQSNESYRTLIALRRKEDSRRRRRR